MTEREGMKRAVPLLQAGDGEAGRRDINAKF
jgi:hypothetical protein